MALRPIDIVLRAIGADAVRDALKGVGDDAGKMADDVKGAGEKTGAGLDGATSKAEQLKGGLESVRTAGLALAAAGVGAIALGNSLGDAFIEADRLNGKMQSLLAGKGLSAASDEIKKLGGDIAALTGGDDDQVATAIASAIASGRVQGLKEYGIVISDTGKAAIKAAKDVSEQAGAQETLNQVMLAGGAAVATLRGTLSDATIQTGEFQVRWGNTEEAIGAGSARARAAILGGLVGPLMMAIEQNPGLGDTAGALLYIGGAAATGIGSVVAFASQIALTSMAFPGLMASGVTAFTAIRTAALVTAPAMWAAFAPLIPLILAIAAAALIATAAIYVLSGAQKAIDDAKKDGAQADAADKEFYDKQVVRRDAGKKSYVNAGESYEAYRKRVGRGAENSEDPTAAADPTAQIADIQRQMSGVSAPGAAPPMMPSAQQVSSSITNGAQIGGGVGGVGGVGGGQIGAASGGNSQLQLGARIAGQNARGNFILEIIAPPQIEIPGNGVGSLAGGF